MKLFAKLKLATAILEGSGCQWAIAGGVAACLYRETPRYTGDIDFCISDSKHRPAIDVARQVASEMGYVPQTGFVTDQYGRLVSEPALIVGREDRAGAYLGVDFLLPVLEWVAPAVARAQINKLDYGFAYLPTITPEDLIVAKLAAYQGTPERVQDLDDVRSILRHMKNLDTKLIRELCASYSIRIAEGIESALIKQTAS